MIDMGIADLHVHSIYSFDGTASIPQILERACEAGLDIIAITDHDSIRGALQAAELAPRYDVQVLPGIEISTAEGHLLGLSISSLVPAGLSLIETVGCVGELGGFCVAPHPTAAWMGKSALSAYSIREALRDRDTARILIGIETYNATVMDRACNEAARILAERSDIAQTGSSDAHVIGAIGLGATFFPGYTVDDLVAALWNGTTQVRRQPEWGPAHILGSWAAGYLKSKAAGLRPALAQ